MATNCNLTLSYLINKVLNEREPKYFGFPYLATNCNLTLPYLINKVLIGHLICYFDWYSLQPNNVDSSSLNPRFANER